MKVEPKSLSLFIPVHPKDIPVLPTTISTLRQYARPRINSVTIIASEATRLLLKGYLKSAKVKFINEDSVIPQLRRDQVPPIMRKGENRASWFYQQFIKFELCHLVKEPSYLVFDADAVVLKRTRFIDNGRYVFHRASQHYQPYFRTHADLFGYKPPRVASYISDFMVYDRAVMLEMINSIEKRFGCRWYEAIIKLVTKDKNKSFAEPETYGLFMEKYHPELMVSKPERSLSLPRRLFPYHWLLRWPLSLKYNTISYHNYNR